jgi:hypothetical protein
MNNKDFRLHIEEVKERFKTSKKISVDDFNEFYKEVFGDIKKGTVSWYIYELKKLGVIRNVSRGQYVLEVMEFEQSEEYIVITIDIIKSSKIDHRSFNLKLENHVKKLNEIINRKYEHNRTYSISQGDELQIIYPFKEGIGDMMMLTLSHLFPFIARYGISIGEMHDSLKMNSWEMNGPIFWNARDQLEKLKSASNYEGLIISGFNKADKISNNIIRLINRSLGKITDKQWEAIRYELSNQNLDETLRILGIGKSSYFERLDVSNLSYILSSFEAIFELMQIRRKIN